MADDFNIPCGKCVVLDSGTGSIKCGFAGSNFPTAVFSTAIGRPVLRADQNFGGRTLKDVMIGDECNEARHLLDMRYPVRNGVVQNWDDMELLWKYAFEQKLKIDPTDGGYIVVGEPPAAGKQTRVDTFSRIFDKFGFQGAQMQIQGVLSLYSAGIQSGIVVDSGEGVTHCLPVFEGMSLPFAVRRVDIGGRNITEYLIKLMQRRGYSFNRSADFDTVRQLKEMFCYAAVDFKLEKRLAFETTTLEKAFKLPDGKTLNIGSERFEATEALFNPGLLDFESEGLSDQLWNSIEASDIDIRKHLYAHVVLSGGSTMFPGLPTRIEKDMTAMFLQKKLKGDKSRLGNFKLNIDDAPRRKHMVYLGGAVIGELTLGMADAWITKKEWDECGDSIIQQKLGR